MVKKLKKRGFEGERAGLRGKECFDRKSLAEVFAHGCGEGGEPISDGGGALYVLRFGSKRASTLAFPKIEIRGVLPHPGTKWGMWGIIRRGKLSR